MTILTDDRSLLADVCLHSINGYKLGSIADDLERLIGQLTVLGDTESATKVVTQLTEWHRFTSWIDNDLEPKLAQMAGYTD